NILFESKLCGDLPFQKSIPFYNFVLTPLKDSDLKIDITIEFLKEANTEKLLKALDDLGLSGTLISNFGGSIDTYGWNDEVPYDKWKEFHSEVLAPLRPHRLEIDTCIEFTSDEKLRATVLKAMNKLDLDMKGDIITPLKTKKGNRK
ncbi:MAG: hypothetical protein ACR2PH_02685, partial [Desulfobulbia bacterium]